MSRAKRVKDLHPVERPRERLEALGPAALKNEELLAILLRSGYKGKGALNLAHFLLEKYPDRKLFEQPVAELKALKGIGLSKAATLAAAFELSKRFLSGHENHLPKIDSALKALDQLMEFRVKKKEHFVALYLNARQQLIHREIISIGTVSESLVHPREVFSPAMKHLASSVLVAHNHPSQDSTPSREDILLTKKLLQAGEILGIELLDHLIVTENSYWSFKQNLK